MSTNPFLAQLFVERRVKDALREAEHDLLVRKAQDSKGTRPVLLSAMQFIRDWWSGGNGRHQPTIDNVKQRNLAGQQMAPFSPHS